MSFPAVISAMTPDRMRDVVVPDFPSPGQTTTLTWQEEQQNFAIKSVGP